MKALTAFLAVTTLALGALCITQWRNLDSTRRQLESAHAEIDAANRQTEEMQAIQKRLEQQKNDLMQLAAESAAAARAATQQLAAATSSPPATVKPAAVTVSAAEPEKDGGGLRGMLANMMKDPETRKFIRDQQRQMMDQLYGPLIKKMGLSAEEGEKFKDLLADNMMQGAEKATSLFGGTNRAELIATMTAEQKKSEEVLKDFLGEDRYNLYKDYQETAGERTQLTMFKQQNASSDYPVSDIQIEELLAFMQQEKQSLAATGQQFPGNSQDPANFDAMLSPERLDQFIQSQEALNQRVYERAKTVLSPQQLESFAKFQGNQLQMMRMGFSMARKLMGPSEPSAAGTQPPQ